MAKETQHEKTFLAIASSLIAMVMTLLVSFFLSPFIVKTLGVEANGYAQLANNFVNYATLITIALNSMAGRFITISYYKKDFISCNRYYSSIIVGNIAIFLFLFLPAVYCVIRLDQIINLTTSNSAEVKYLFAFVFANFFVSQIISIINISCYVTNTQYLHNNLVTIKIILNALLLLVLFSLFPPKIYYVSLVGMVLTVLSLPPYFEIKKRILPELKFKLILFDLKCVFQLITSGIWNTINQVGNILMTGLDLLIANLFISPIQMGILAIAKTIPSAIIMSAMTINTSFLPNLTITYADPSKDKLLTSLKSAMKISNVLVSIPIMAMCIYGKSFYRLWVPSLDSNNLAILSIITIMPFIPFAGTQVLYNLYTTTNKLKINSISALIGGFVNFLVVVFLLRTTDLGLIAVAGVSSIISILRNLIITVPYSAKILNLKWYTFYSDVATSLVCCLLNGILCAVTQWLIVPINWELLIVSMMVAVTFCLMVCLLLLLNKEEKKKLRLKIQSIGQFNGKNS